MIVSILHFSDIHFSKDRNAVFQRKEKIFDSIKNELTGKDFLFILTSGDIAFSGLASEYDAAKEFYKYIYKSIKEYTNLEGRLVFVPGNHDCFFDEKEDQVRKIVLDNLARNGLADLSEALIEICCKPQENFNAFIKNINKSLPYTADVIFDHLLLKVLTFKVGGKVIKFNCYNTAWDSFKNEKIGNLRFPIDYLYDQIPVTDNQLSISIIHHPFNWQSPENSKELREALFQFSEIIVSGHEHQSSESIESDLNEYYKTILIESAALQENNPDISGFNIINIDMEKQKFQIKKYQFEAIDSKYALKESSEWHSIEKSRKLKAKAFQLKSEYLQFLENPEASFTHSNVDEVKMSDIYTSPILNNVSFDKSKNSKFINFVHSEIALDLPEGHTEKFYKLIMGNESSGKTALLKFFYLKLYAKNYYPVLLSADNINDTNGDKIKAIIGKEFKKQYDELESSFEEIDYKKIVLLIDDLHKYKYKKYKIKLITSLTKLFDKMIITGNELMAFESYTDGRNNPVEIFEYFDQYIIQEFNPTLRNTLVNKWYRLGKDYLDQDEQKIFYKQTDIAHSTINDIIGKNLIPAYPIYILSILQALESGQNDSSSNNLHAYYYELLITKSLKKVLSDQDDIGFYMTLCKEYFYFLFDQQIRFKPLSKDGFLEFLKFHATKYSITNLNPDVAIDVLQKSRILKYSQFENSISITFKYLYYYFVAKYLSDSIDTEETKKIIDRMADRVYRDEYSNIILFLTHLTKNNFIIDKLIEKSRKIFEKVSPLKLETDIDFINVLQKELPQQVLDNLNIEDSRKDNLEEEDKIESNEKGFMLEKADDEYDLDEDITSLDYIALLSKAMRTIAILGQLTKKYWGELQGPVKYNLTEETFMLGLRTLKVHFTLLENGKDMLSDHIINVIQKRFIHENLSRAEVDAISAKFIFTLASSSVFGILKRVVSAIGTEKLSSTFSEVQKIHTYNSTELINTGIKLDHYSSFPMNDIEEMKKKNDKNPLVSSILQAFAIDHLYMYTLPYDKTQKLCKLLNIKIQDQRFIAQTSQIKKS